MQHPLLRFALLLLLSAACASPAFAQKGTATFFLGGSLNPLQLNDLEDFDISNWASIGGTRLENDSFPEARLRLPLSENDASYTYGVSLGLQYWFVDRFSVIPRVDFNFGNGVNGTGAALGFAYDVVAGEVFRLGIQPEVGYYFYSQDVGAWQSLPNYQSEVDFDVTGVSPSPRAVAGGEVTAKYGNVVLRLGLSPSIRLSERFSLMANVAFHWMPESNIEFFSDVQQQTLPDVLVPITDADVVVQPDLSSTPAAINPSASALGVSALLGFAIHFGDGSEEVHEYTD